MDEILRVIDVKDDFGTNDKELKDAIIGKNNQKDNQKENINLNNNSSNNANSNNENTFKYNNEHNVKNPFVKHIETL